MPSLAEQLEAAMLVAPHPSTVWDSKSNDWLRMYVPELLATKYVRQRGEEFVWEHLMKVLDVVVPMNTVTCWAALLHDVGKTDKSNGPTRFTGHEVAGARIVRSRLAKLKASPNVIDAVARIVRTHMIDIEHMIYPQAIRNFIAWVGPDNVEAWFSLRRADAKVYGNHRSMELIARFEERVELNVPETGLVGDLQITLTQIGIVTGITDRETLERIRALLRDSVASHTLPNDNNALGMAAQIFARID